MLRSARALLLASAAVSLSSCTVMNGNALENMVDHTLVTGSIAAPPAPDREQISDSRTVRNAVSAADLSAIDTQPLGWVNADTGASGTIMSIVEERAGERICRSFKTSRQRFDGVALYAGQACTSGGGEWTLTSFAEGG